ncbi:MAG: hybrid sensor histidine kinase/response regulator [Synechococcales bacterium]|nr:hybrid sensor histidine kinase/response regulator [Synechococcales bacterium]
MYTVDAELRDQAYQFFKQESVDLLQVLEAGLLNLRYDRTLPSLQNLMRAAHSIKGGAGTVGLSGIQRIAHRLEDVFRSLYQWQDEISPDLEELLLEVYDGLRMPLMMQIQTGHYDENSAWEAVEPCFAQLIAILGEASAIAPLSTVELGIDVVQEVFAGDVEQGLIYLEMVVQKGESPVLVGELRAQAEVFIGTGELLELPGFVQIAQTLETALNHAPDQALAIGKLALADFRAAQKAVLAGDRRQGGNPSTELFSFATRSSHSHSGEAPLTDLWNGLLENGSELTSDLANGFSDDLVSAFFDDHADDLFNHQLNDFSADFSENLLLTEESPLESLEAISMESLMEASIELFVDVPREATVEATVESTLVILPDNDLDSKAEFFATLPVEIETEENFLENTNNILEQEADNALETQVFAHHTVGNAIDNHHDDRNAVEEVVVERNIAKEPTKEPTTDLDIIPIVPDRRAHAGDRRSVEMGEASPALSPMVRVDLQRLERLNNLVGEMVTQENSVLLYNQQLQSSIKQLQKRFETFERLTKLLQNQMDRSQNVGLGQSAGLSQTMSLTQPLQGMSSRTGLGQALQETLVETPALAPTFDSLQLDDYSDLHQLMQEAVDEIAHMGETMRDMGLITQQTQQTQRVKQQTLKQVRNDLLWARMIPLGDILQRFPRMLRDLSTRYEKQVDFRIIGANTLVDKAVLEKLFDPLVHLVRNAFDHGTETPEERIRQGKSAQAAIEIRAYHRGNQTLIEVWDDGRGVDLAKVKEVAIARNLLTTAAAKTVSAEQLYSYLFTPDFSTKTATSELSGRGVGLSTVQEQVKQLKGSIELTSQPGKETLFTIRLPLTLTIAKLLVFSVDDKYMAITVDTLVGIVMADEDTLPTIQGQRYYREGDELVPVFPTSVFAHRYPLPSLTESGLRPIPLPRNGKIPMLLIADGATLIALEVDQILNEQELVIKPFGSLLQPPPYLYGCTVLADGTLVPVVDGSVLVHYQTSEVPSFSSHVSQSVFSDALPSLSRSVAQSGQPSLSNQATVLVIDDALTARQTLTLTLQKAGYHVIQANDGREGLAKLRQAAASVRAIFCDVEMPNMNGFEFLTTCRREFTNQTWSIIMLTSRSSDKHRGIAKMLGADRYLTKPYLEREVLQTLQDCLAAV